MKHVLRISSPHICEGDPFRGIGVGGCGAGVTGIFVLAGADAVIFVGIVFVAGAAGEGFGVCYAGCVGVGGGAVA